jgi:hypothetical protein
MPGKQPGQAGNVRARKAVQSDYGRTLQLLQLLICFEGRLESWDGMAHQGT